jgi:hypothetical protein
MIRMSAETGAGRRLIVLGLSEKNIEKLREGKPIHIHADDMGFAGEIMIFTGKDEATMTDMVKPFIGPETQVNDERNRPRQ